MNRSGFDAQGFKRDLRRLARQVKAQVGPAMDAGSNDLADEMRRRCPVDKGALRASIEVKPVKATAKRVYQDVSIGAGLPHPEAAQVEYGTMYVAPIPFIRQAAHAKEASMVARIEAAMPDE